MSAARYAAVFAEDLSLSDAQRENLGYTDGIASIAELVGTTMETNNNIARSMGWDFWPVAGAEAAAAYVNQASETLPLPHIVSLAVSAAIRSGFTEGLSPDHAWN